jgi:hypothetical protein
MAHHQAPNLPTSEGKELRDFKIHSNIPSTPHLNHSSREVERQREIPPPQEKSIFDYQIAGFPWPFVLVISVIAIGVLAMVLKVLDVY